MWPIIFEEFGSIPSYIYLCVLITETFFSPPIISSGTFLCTHFLIDSSPRATAVSIINNENLLFLPISPGIVTKIAGMYDIFKLFHFILVFVRYESD